MIFGIWWAWWLFFAVIIFCFLRLAYTHWEATRPPSEEEKAREAEAWRRSWEAYGPKRRD